MKIFVKITAILIAASMLLCNCGGNNNSDNGEITKLATLVETALLVKDRDKTSRASRRLSAAALENVIRQYSALAKSDDPAIAQEAKNSIAELKFVQTELKR